MNMKHTKAASERLRPNRPFRRALGARRATLAAIGAIGAFAISPMLSAPAFAQGAYPERSVRLVVPYPPGGATDVIGRVLGQALSDGLGQPVVVDNRAGAGGSLGAGIVAKAQPDGYTLLMGAMTSHSINAALQPKITPFDIEKSFAPVAIVAVVPLVFVVHPAVPAKSLQELIALAKTKPGSLAFASAGNGSPQHLALEMFKRQAGVDVLHVPYKGSGPAMTDLMGGQVQAMIETAPAALPHVRNGKLRALAVASAEPVPMFPDLPTAASAGLPDFVVSSMFGVAAPAGTPQPVIDRLNAELKKALENPKVREGLLAQGAIAAYTTPAEAAARISAEYQRWAKLIADAGVTLE